MFMWIILAALAFGAVFDGLGVGRALENLFVGQLRTNPWVIIVLKQLSSLLMGTSLDDAAMLVIVAPLYVPLVKVLGFDLIWSVVYDHLPDRLYDTAFSYNLFIMRTIAPLEISIIDVCRSVIPFVGVKVVMLAIMMVFPKLAMWLSNHVYGK